MSTLPHRRRRRSTDVAAKPERFAERERAAPASLAASLCRLLLAACLCLSWLAHVSLAASPCRLPLAACLCLAWLSPVSLAASLCRLPRAACLCLAWPAPGSLGIC